jgi:hypothetical protein
MPTEQDFQSIKSSVEEVVTYPVLTQETAGSDFGGGGSSQIERNGSFSDSLTRTAQQTIRELLGWRVRHDDTKGFLAALTKTVSLKEVEGHIEWTWRPPLYVLQSDMGEITGAQASVHKQASVALEQALPLLDGLKPLRSDADEEDSEAMRAIIRTVLKELVSELAISGGPRVQRVDSFFERLLALPPRNPGDAPVNTDPELVRGQLLRLKDRFGLQRERVNTVLEEQNLTNFLILVDYAYTLYNSWQSKRNYFLRNGTAEPFFGTQLVLVSQALDVIAEQVRETYAAMDSVFFGPSERQVTMLNLPNEAPITVAELLGWVDTFATQEGRQLIQDGGKDGMVIFRATSERLTDLVQKAAALAAQPALNPGRSFHTKRVANTLSELATYLLTAKNRAAEVSRRPFRIAEEVGDEENLPLPPVPAIPNAGLQSVISKIEPIAPADDNDLFRWEMGSRKAKLRVIGRNLCNGFSLDFLGPLGLSVQRIDVDKKTCETAIVTVDIAPGTQAGPWDVRVKNSGGLQQTFAAAIKLAQQRTVPTKFVANQTNMNPASGTQGQRVPNFTLNGPNIGTGVNVRFARDVRVISVSYPPAGGLIADLEISRNAEPGDVDVEVYSADCGRATLSQKFTILKSPDLPAIFKVTTKCECGQDLHEGPCPPPVGKYPDDAPANVVEALRAKSDSLKTDSTALAKARQKAKEAAKAACIAYKEDPPITEEELLTKLIAQIPERSKEGQQIANLSKYVGRSSTNPVEASLGSECAIRGLLERSETIVAAYLLPKGKDKPLLKNRGDVDYYPVPEPDSPLPVSATIVFDTSDLEPGEYELAKIMSDGSLHHVLQCAILR